ncbi:hypothetical protein ADUPG1_000709, partial [Aduncisulcus paluster]
IEEFTSNRLFEAKVTFDTVSLTYTDCTQSAKSYSNNGVCEMCENATKGGIGATVCTDCTLRELCTPTTYSTISSSDLYTVSIITSSSMTSSSAVFNVEFQVDDVAKSSLDPGDVVTVVITLANENLAAPDPSFSLSTVVDIWGAFVGDEDSKSVVVAYDSDSGLYVGRVSDLTVQSVYSSFSETIVLSDADSNVLLTSNSISKIRFNSNPFAIEGSNALVARNYDTTTVDFSIDIEYAAKPLGIVTFELNCDDVIYQSIQDVGISSTKSLLFTFPLSNTGDNEVIPSYSCALQYTYDGSRYDVMSNDASVTANISQSFFKCNSSAPNRVLVDGEVMCYSNARLIGDVVVNTSANVSSTDASSLRSFVKMMSGETLDTVVT